MAKAFHVKFSNGNVARAVKIRYTAEIETALEKIGLQISVPTVVLIGGAAGLSDDELNQLSPFFIEMLAPLMNSSNISVIDGGTDAGIMQLMGQACAKIAAKFPLIGVAAKEKEFAHRNEICQGRICLWHDPRELTFWF